MTTPYSASAVAVVGWRDHAPAVLPGQNNAGTSLCSTRESEQSTTLDCTAAAGSCSTLPCHHRALLYRGQDLTLAVRDIAAPRRAIAAPCPSLPCRCQPAHCRRRAIHCRAVPSPTSALPAQSRQSSAVPLRGHTPLCPCSDVLGSSQPVPHTTSRSPAMPLPRKALDDAAMPRRSQGEHQRAPPSLSPAQPCRCPGEHWTTVPERYMARRSAGSRRPCLV